MFMLPGCGSMNPLSWITPAQKIKTVVVGSQTPTKGGDASIIFHPDGRAELNLNQPENTTETSSIELTDFILGVDEEGHPKKVNVKIEVGGTAPLAWASFEQEEYKGLSIVTWLGGFACMISLGLMIVTFTKWGVFLGLVSWKPFAALAACGAVVAWIGEAMRDHGTIAIIVFVCAVGGYFAWRHGILNETPEPLKNRKRK